MHQDTLATVVTLCQQAGEAILDIYRGAEGIHIDKKADNSPLTQADLAAHHILEQGLSSLLGGLPILSEEGQHAPFSVRQHWDRYWLVDPLDGTKEFIERNGEFTVNVALIEHGLPVLGVVHIPVQGITYTGAADGGAHKHHHAPHEPDTVNSIQTRSAAQRTAQRQPLSVLTSRRHGVEALTPVLQQLTRALGPIATQQAGSSLKLCLIAEGKADLYPRLAPTCEWDTAAAQAVVEAAGGAVLHWQGNGQELSRLRYNHKDSLLNPSFYVVGDPLSDWTHLLRAQ